jgi:hypothetical protein
MDRVYEGQKVSLGRSRGWVADCERIRSDDGVRQVGRHKY